MRGERGLVTCPRCGTTTRRSSARFCNRCRVFLCPACTRKKQCPSKDPSHRPRTPRLTIAWLFGVLLAIPMLSIGALVYWTDGVDRGYAEMPVTAVAALAPGTTAKVNGTMESSAVPVIHWTGTTRSGHWVVGPFNVTDPTGSIPIDTSRIDGEDSKRILQSGIHVEGEWWPGDPVSVVGDVVIDRTGNLSLVATRVARTPTSFSRPSDALLVFVATGGAGGAIAVVSLWTRARLRRDHEANAPAYPYRLTDWRVCANCGDRVPSAEPHCPACGAATLRDPVRSPPFDRLPALDLGTHFSKLPLTERAATVFFTVVFPIPLLALAIWLALLPGFQFQTGWLMIVLLAVIFPAVFGSRFLARTRVLLGPGAAEQRAFRSGGRVATNEIDRAMTVRHGARVVHFVFNRGGLFVAFGPGLQPADMEAARQWVRSLAELAGVPYREANSLQEAVVLLERDA